MKKSLLWKLKVLLIVSMFVILFSPGFTAEAAKEDVTINVKKRERFRIVDC